MLGGEGLGMWTARKFKNVHKRHLLCSFCLGLKPVCLKCIVCTVCVCMWICMESALAARRLAHFCPGGGSEWMHCGPGLCLRHAPCPTPPHCSPGYYSMSTWQDTLHVGQGTCRCLSGPSVFLWSVRMMVPLGREQNRTKMALLCVLIETLTNLKIRLHFAIFLLSFHSWA